MASSEGEGGRAAGPRVDGPYAWYALAILVLVYVANFVDRQILSILAEEIKADLGVSDAQLGFLYGTAFAVFYAVFGIPLARLSDMWVRKNVIALGLAVWSLMTALSGTAQRFLSLGLYRVGVGIGEASATPAAYSMITDYFPERIRATALSIYAAGVYIGQGLGLYIGGAMIDGWNAAFEGVGPMGIRGWQAAFFAVGLPGLALAVWVATLREPRRGQQEALTTPTEHPHPFRELLVELAAVIPGFTVWSLARAGATRAQLAINVAVGVAIAGVAAGLVATTGEPQQWYALALGLYAAFSWGQGLALRDPPVFALIAGSAAMRWILVGVGFAAFVTYSFMFWASPFILRAHGASATEVGFWLGWASIVGGGFGAVAGGLLSDVLKARMPNGRLVVVLLGTAVYAVTGVALLSVESVGAAYGVMFALNVGGTLWIGSATAVVTDLVLPRMRAIATAILLMMYTFLGLALRPFAVGRISDALAQGGTAPAEALRSGLMAGLLPLLITAVATLIAMRHLPAEEAGRLERARAAGEPLDG